MKSIKTDLKILLAIIIGGYIIFTSYVAIKDVVNIKNYDVSGVIYGKSNMLDIHKKHVYTEYKFAVRPDDKSKFRNFSVNVDFATFSSFNVGDRIVFHDMAGHQVLRDCDQSGWHFVCVMFGWIFLSIITVSGLSLLVIWICEQ